MSSRNRFPGFDYLDRVGQAWLSAMSSQMQGLNDAWAQIRQGEIDHGSMMQVWAQTVESYFDTVVEATRGPGYVYQPVWLCFEYRQARPLEDVGEVPETLQDTVRISRVEVASTNLEPTPFAAIDLHVSIPPQDIYDTCSWVGVSRSEIQVNLKMERVRRAEIGQYISFILPKGRTGEAPLVIVMLRVTA